MTPETLAALHARAFPGPPRAWTAEEFASFLSDPAVSILTAADAFLVTRRAGPEAEVLTLCTAPEARRKGQARALMTQFEGDAQAADVEEIFLEVAETNVAARALYAALGYSQRGHRKDYYSQGGRQRVHAYVLSKPLRPRG